MESVNKMQCNPGHKVIVCDIWRLHGFSFCLFVL